MLLLAPTFLKAQTNSFESPGVRADMQQVLVLTSGKVITGKISARPDGYEIVVVAGRIFVPSDMVRFQADSVDDAYIKLRKSLPELTPNNHVELARWCEANKLYVQARRELLDALRLDPNRGEAKRMLQSLISQEERLGAAGIDGTLSTNQPTTSAAAEVSSGTLTLSAASTSDRTQAVETRSLGGFSKPVARDFVQRVQPLLMNKCASGGCHGNGAGGFSVVSSRNGSTPVIAERNLAAVLKFVDLQNPRSSPILRAVAGSHGGSAGSVLSGRSGQLQMEQLRAWVTSAAAEISPQTAQSDDNFANAGTGFSGESFTSAPGSQDSPRAFGEGSADLIDSADSGNVKMLPGEGTPHGRRITMSESDARVLQEVAYMNRRDAFDPEIFNRKFHAGQSLEINPSRKESQ